VAVLEGDQKEVRDFREHGGASHRRSSYRSCNLHWARWVAGPLGSELQPLDLAPVRGSNLNRRTPRPRGIPVLSIDVPLPDRVAHPAAEEWGGDYSGWGGVAAET